MILDLRKEQVTGTACVTKVFALKAIGANGTRCTAREENGGAGAKAYSAQARRAREKHIFALESDGGGFTPRGFSFTGKGNELTPLQSFLPFLKPYGVYEFTSSGAGADVEPLHDSTGVLAAELLPDSQRYFDYHHSASDTLDKVNKRELELGAINMAALIYLIDKHGL